jgi:hypothetical protein
VNIGRAIKRLSEMEQEAYRVGITIQQKLSDQAVEDARPSAFYKLAQLFRSCKIYFILREEYLQHEEWYIMTYLQKWHQAWPTSAIVGGKKLVHHNDHSIINKDFDQVMSIGYIQTLFSIMESRFRLFVEALGTISNIKQDPSGKFWEVRKALLREINKENHREFIEFFVLIRNTIHNNGVYLNRKKQKPILYKGTVYHFEYGKPVDYYQAFDFLIFDLTPDVISMFKDIILGSDKILTIPWIKDPMDDRDSI